MLLGPRWRNPHLAPGMRLGRYRILRKLAIGGMAEIFLARVEGWLRGFDKVVVIKRLLPQHMARRNLVRMFLDEARLMATLNHPNIAQVNDVGSARGSYFFAMEYVYGADLRDILRASMRAGAPVPIDQAIGIIAEAAAGLHHAHERRASDGTALSIVHRDVSPSNVLVSYDGAVKVTDFGVAKWARQDSETRHGALKGKFAYMSPEQCRGEPLDPRSDVFALGILLYELTTGTRVYQGASDFAILRQIVDQDVTPPSSRRPDYPPELERIVLRALCRDKTRRYQSARDLQMALEALAHERRIPTSPVARARFMQDLFAARVAAWHAAEEQGRSLAQHLATLPDDEGVTADDEPDVSREGTRGDGSDHEGPARLPSLSFATDPGPSKSRVAVAAGVGLFAVAAAGAATWAWRSRVVPTPSPPAVVRKAPPAAPPPPAEPAPSEAATEAVVAASAPTLEPEAPPFAKKPRGKNTRRPARGKATAAKPQAAAPPPAPAQDRVKVWDPDSLFLPK